MSSTISGDAELKRKLAKLKDFSQLQPTLIAGGEHLKEIMMPYPAGNQHRPQEFVSDKQRRYFFWALREGIIEVPYRRGQSPGSEDIQQAWNVKPEGWSRVIVGNDTTYGPLVQGAGTQTAYHQQTGWKTEDQGMKEGEAEVLNLIKKKVDQILATG